MRKGNFHYLLNRQLKKNQENEPGIITHCEKNRVWFVWRMLHISSKIYGAINAQGLRFRALVVFNPVPTAADGVTVTDVADSDVIAAADAVTVPKL